MLYGIPLEKRNCRTTCHAGQLPDGARQGPNDYMKCLRAWAKAGSPLVILTKDGELYLPISDKMPDEDQREKLMPLLGKYVRASGTVYERKGTRAIAISEIRELKDVDLMIEDQ